MRSALGLVFLCALCGCDRALMPVAVAAFGLGMNAAIQEVRHPVEAPFGPYTVSYVGVPSAPARGGPASPGMAYDEEDAIEALRSVSLAPCARPRGRPQRAFVRAAFNRAGTVSQVTIDSPSALRDAEVTCLTDAFGRASIPAYEGEVHVARMSFVLP